MRNRKTAPKERSEKFKFYKKYFIVRIPLYILILVAGVVAGYSFGLYEEFSKNDRTVSMKNIVYADVTDVINIKDTHGYSTRYWVNYEYNDGEYRYIGYITVTGEDKANSYKDTKVQIYIDGKGYHVAAANYWGNGAAEKALVAGAAGLVIFGLLVGLAVISFIKQRKKFLNLEKQDDLQADNNNFS